MVSVLGSIIGGLGKTFLGDIIGKGTTVLGSLFTKLLGTGAEKLLDYIGIKKEEPKIVEQETPNIEEYRPIKRQRKRKRYEEEIPRKKIKKEQYDEYEEPETSAARMYEEEENNNNFNGSKRLYEK